MGIPHISWVTAQVWGRGAGEGGGGGGIPNINDDLSEMAVVSGILK